ncbi:catalase-related domain-containing protein [Niabella hibiscisoli]|uniref:catalase-related domain-containing protein n=1 Tax=Niabella hibiscisoli TaxID=1825928 RepID=UPI001F118490|nr:catalase-related domain-containing protein [Niabella hibiscisoli]MCH5718748.1 hypothetical protein [Niabella hibiscisoli]
MAEGGFHSYEERIDAKKVRARSRSFFDHFSQATLFYNSQSEIEKRHIQNAFSFELGKVLVEGIRQRIVDMLLEVDADLANIVAANLGLTPKKLPQPITGSIPADGDTEAHYSFKEGLPVAVSEALSMQNTIKDIKTRKIAILAADGVNGEALLELKTTLVEAGATCKVIAPKQGLSTPIMAIWLK